VAVSLAPGGDLDVLSGGVGDFQRIALIYVGGSGLRCTVESERWQVVERNHYPSRGERLLAASRKLFEPLGEAAIKGL
jgi:hypothetical protein